MLAETNNEIENPLWHGEVHALKRFYELPASARPDTRDCVFIATHEPCSLCLSAITWTGFDNFYYLFSHEDSRDSFAIPHDLRIIERSLHPGARRLQRQQQLLDGPFNHEACCGPAKCRAGDPAEAYSAITAKYDPLSRSYQQSKADNEIPLN